MRNLALITSLAFAVGMTASSDAFAGKYLGGAYRTKQFFSYSASDVAVPLKNNDAVKSVSFNVDKKQRVKITYNAVCLLIAPRGNWLSVRIMVDGKEANPATGTNFALCSSVDKLGQTYASAVRQSVTVLEAGTHKVEVVARMTGTFAEDGWSLDDSSLVVEGAPLAAATRTLDYAQTEAGKFDLPLNNNGLEELKFTTGTINQDVLVTYNTECSSNATTLFSYIRVDGNASPSTSPKTLCPNDFDSQVWQGVAVQEVFHVLAKGDHHAGVVATANDPTGWSVDDSSIFVDTTILASAWRDNSTSDISTSPVALPLHEDGGDELLFATAKANQLVNITYSAFCDIMASRGTWLGIRVLVDGVEANPKSGYYFAFCSAVASAKMVGHAGFRQSTIVVPKAGVHKIQIFAKLSGDATVFVERGWLVVR